MAKQLVKQALNHHYHHRLHLHRRHLFTVPKPTATGSKQRVASRPRDPTFEKLMDHYKHLFKVISIQDLILGSPNKSLSLDFLINLSDRLRLHRGAASFLRRFPHIFRLSHLPEKGRILCSLADPALDAAREESAAITRALPEAAERLARLLSLSPSKTLPLRGIFKVWRELGLPDDFEDSVIAADPGRFALRRAKEPGTHIVKLLESERVDYFCGFTAAVERWRMEECCKGGCDIEFSFKHEYPPGMRLNKGFKAKVREWQRLPYVGPYDHARKKTFTTAMEKRAVAIVHEFLSLTVEKMAEVEKMSQFRKWFGIEFNMRYLVLDHPGIFYLSTKGKRHSVFLREAYERGGLVCPDPVYEARRKLLHLVAMGRRGIVSRGSENDGSDLTLRE